jgi:hypothetical protein
MNADFLANGLFLLDDSLNNTFIAPWGVEKRVEKKTPPKQTQIPALTSKGKVFRNRPTLKTLMQEYNKPSVKLSTIKPNTVISEFYSQKILRIAIPNIPGKILRPAR